MIGPHSFWGQKVLQWEGECFFLNFWQVIKPGKSTFWQLPMDGICWCWCGFFFHLHFFSIFWRVMKPEKWTFWQLAMDGISWCWCCLFGARGDIYTCRLVITAEIITCKLVMSLFFWTWYCFLVLHYIWFSFQIDPFAVFSN